MEQELKTRLDTNKRVRERTERIMRAAKYLIVYRSGFVDGPFLYKAELQRRIDRDGSDGVVVSFVDINKLPEGLNSYKVEALNEQTGEWYDLTSTWWSPKTLSYWWGTEGKNDIYPHQWKSKKLRFFCNGEPAELVYDWKKKYNFNFPVAVPVAPDIVESENK